MNSLHFFLIYLFSFAKIAETKNIEPRTASWHWRPSLHRMDSKSWCFKSVHVALQCLIPIKYSDPLSKRDLLWLFLPFHLTLENVFCLCKGQNALYLINLCRPELAKKIKTQSESQQEPRALSKAAFIFILYLWYIKSEVGRGGGMRTP